MLHRHRSSAAALLPLAAALLLAGCPPSEDVVTITFDQVGACNGYQQTAGPGGSGPHVTVSAGAHAAFVVFRVVTIDNSKSSKDFNFDPSRIFITGSSPQAFMSSSLSLTQDLGVFAAVPTTVPKGKSVGNNGLMVTVVATGAANGASEANNSSYFLAFASRSGDPGVILAKRDPNRTSWPVTENCRAIRF